MQIWCKTPNNQKTICRTSRFSVNRTIHWQFQSHKGHNTPYQYVTYSTEIGCKENAIFLKKSLQNICRNRNL